MSENKQNTNAFLIHLSSFGGYLFPFGSIVLPLVIWEVTKKDSEFIDASGQQQIRTTTSPLGGTMRLGAQKCHLTPGSKVSEVYGSDEIVERHRHRYEVNNHFVEQLEKAGLSFTGLSEDKKLVEIIENKCEGLVPLRQMLDDFYIFDEKNYQIVGRRYKKKYQLGDKVRIEIISTNIEKKQMDFRLIES